MLSFSLRTLRSLETTFWLSGFSRQKPVIFTALAVVVATGGICGALERVREHWNRHWGAPPPVCPHIARHNSTKSWSKSKLCACIKTSSRCSSSRVMAGRLTFFLCALIGAFSGVLIAPITTVYYDTGFLIGLKGFVAAIIGGLVSYPVAAVGAVLVGLLESYSSFWASAYKEVIVFTMIIPVLLWRSLTTHHVEEEE